MVGNTQSAKGWSSYGSILLATERGKVEIDYLDIVSMQKALSAGEKSLPNVFGSAASPQQEGRLGVLEARSAGTFRPRVFSAADSPMQ